MALTPDQKLTADLEQLKHLERVTQELRASVADRADRSLPTEDDQRAMVGMRARADEHYRTAGLLGSPEPKPFEKPATFRKRVLSDLARIGDSKWAGKDLSSMERAGALDVAEKEIYRDAAANASLYGLKDGEIREVETRGPGGHITREFRGRNASFIDEFAKPIYHGQLRSYDQYGEMTKQGLLSRIAQVVPGWARTVVTGGRAAF